MARKRRTRAQKTKALARRKDNLGHNSPVADQSVEIDQKPTRLPQLVAKKATIANRLNFRKSLMLLSCLIIAQLLLWLIFQNSSIDESFYNWLEL